MRVIILAASLLVSSLAFSQTNTITNQITKQQFVEATIYANSDLDIKKFEVELLNLINLYRIEHKLSVLEIDSNLYKAALIQSDYMVSVNKVTHMNSKAEYSTFSKRIILFINAQRKYSVENCCTGNLKLCYYDSISPAQQIFNTWKNSEGHNLNMLNPNITKIGISLSRSPKFEYFYACFDAVSNL